MAAKVKLGSGGKVMKTPGGKEKLCAPITCQNCPSLPEHVTVVFSGQDPGCSNIVACSGFGPDIVNCHGTKYLLGTVVLDAVHSSPTECSFEAHTGFDPLNEFSCGVKSDGGGCNANLILPGPSCLTDQVIFTMRLIGMSWSFGLAAAVPREYRGAWLHDPCDCVWIDKAFQFSGSPSFPDLNVFCAGTPLVIANGLNNCDCVHDLLPNPFSTFGISSMGWNVTARGIGAKGGTATVTVGP